MKDEKEWNIRCHSLPLNLVAGAVVINMSIFSAVLSYGWQLLAFVWLRVKEPYLERPYRNHIGIPGGVIGLLICLVILVSLLTINAQYRYAALGE